LFGTKYVDEAYHDAHFEEDEAYGYNENNDATDEGEYLLVNRLLQSHYVMPFQCHPCNAALCSPILSVQPYQ
jgi:hypothetical protein